MSEEEVNALMETEKRKWQSHFVKKENERRKKEGGEILKDRVRIGRAVRSATDVMVHILWPSVL